MTEEARIIYLAAPWVNKAEARAAKRALEAAGHQVNSRWIDDHAEISMEDPHRRSELVQQAQQDLEDLEASNTFVILNLGKSEGKATELGYALAFREITIEVLKNEGSCTKKCCIPEIYLVGPREINVFYHLPEVQQVDTLEQLIERLG